MVMKYPRTSHLSFSPQIHSDDKVVKSDTLFLNKQVIVTEKLDGGCCAIHNGKVYARTVTQEADHESFDYIKQVHAHKTLPSLEEEKIEGVRYFDLENITVYGENMYAVHSIEYNKLDDYFYVYAVKENDIFLSWQDVLIFCQKYKFKIVPLVTMSVFLNTNQIKGWLDREILLPSNFGTTREGFVIRSSSAFHINDFDKNIAKYVRANHIQTDDDWSRNWKKHELLK